MAKKRRKRRLRKWVKMVMALGIVAFFAAAGLTIWTIYAQSVVEDTEYRYVYEKPLVRVDEAIRYDMEGGIFYRTVDEEKVPVIDQSLVVSEDGETFHEIRTDESGRLITGWHEGGDGKYYYTKDHGWLITESGEIEGKYYALSNTGRVLDHEWVHETNGYCWYEDGVKAGLQEDTLLYIEGEKGFYYLSAENGFARSESCEKFLNDGRQLLFDEHGHLIDIRTVTENGMVYFPVPESHEVSAETKQIPLSELVMETPAEETISSVNHRGYHVYAPENSLSAYMASYDEGYNKVECDIQFTADGIPVLLHNGTINAVARNSDGSALGSMIPIDSLTFEQVLGYDFGIAAGESYRGLKITRLDVFLAWCRAYGIHPYLEMKGETVDTQEEVDLLIAMVDSYGMRDNVTWISFSSDALQFVMNRDANARIGYLIGNSTPSKSFFAQLGALRAQGQDVFLDAPFTSADKLIGSCEENGVPLEVWTVNSDAYVRTLNPYISAITTDYLHADDILGY